MRGERLAAPIVALLLVTTAVGAGVAPAPVQPAQAQAGDGSGGACTSSDWFLTLITGTIITTDCKTAGDVSDSWNETDADQTRTQIHSQAGQLGAGNEQFLTAMSNSLAESDTIAFSKGEAAAVEVLANNGNISEAQQAANASVDDYYATKQLNLYDRVEVSTETVLTLKSRANNTTGVSRDFITFGAQDDFADSYDASGGDPSAIRLSTAISRHVTQTQALSTLNGTSKQVTVLGIDMRNNTDPAGYRGFSPEQTRKGGSLGTGMGQDYTLNATWYSYSAMVEVDRIKVRPTANLTSTTAINYRKWHDQSAEIETKATKTKQELAVYINQSLGPAVESGELNATNYVSPSTLAQEYAQSYKNPTSYVDATALAAYSGMSTPDLNNTGSMTVSMNGSTYTGLLLSQNAPDAGWESGQSYNPDLLSGIQLFAVAGENGRIIELDQQFTVEEISGPNGDPISTADTVEVTYETANTSGDYAALQEQIRTLNEQYEERKAQATSGGSDTTTNTGLLDQLAAALGVSAGVAVAVVAAIALIAAKAYSP